MQKKYMSEVIGTEYREWGNGKVIISAQTGRGKSQFIMEEAIPWWLYNDKKVLILVNRRSLWKQYIYDEALVYDRYVTNLRIATYQEYAKEIMKSGSLIGAFLKYDIVVMDEAHFFISDSDFNPEDTYIVWQAVFHSCDQCMIFMSATLEELQPFLSEYEIYIKSHSKGNEGSRSKFWKYSIEADYDYVMPEIIPDSETLIAIISKSAKKSVIFINDIAQGKEMRNQIKSIDKEKKVVCLDASSMDCLNQEEKRIMESLYMANKVECDVLITTSVLDNGVSIHDSEVENIVIFTNSKSSFLQMLGRVRTEDTEKLRLLMIPCLPTFWEQCEQILDEEVKEIDRLTEGKHYKYECSFLCKAFLNASRMLGLYKKIFVMLPDNEEFSIYDGEEHFVMTYTGREKLVINRLAVAKIKQMLQVVRRMNVLSRRNAEEACYEQLSWIDKDRDSVINVASTYLEEEERKMLECFLEVQDYDKEMFSKWKKEFAKKFKNSCLKNLNIDSGKPIKASDLTKILEKEGLQLISELNKDRRNRYTIKKIQ